MNFIFISKKRQIVFFIIVINNNVKCVNYIITILKTSAKMKNQMENHVCSCILQIMSIYYMKAVLRVLHNT